MLRKSCGAALTVTKLKLFARHQNAVLGLIKNFGLSNHGTASSDLLYFFTAVKNPFITYLKTTHHFSPDHGRGRRWSCSCLVRSGTISQRRQTLRCPHESESQADRVRFEPSDHHTLLVADVQTGEILLF